jgi:sugar (pentulose or hexulose) kinase
MTLTLSIDAGTTQMKMAIVEDGRHIHASAERAYPMNIRPGGQCDLDTNHWWKAFLDCCNELKDRLGELGEVQAISLSVP